METQDGVTAEQFLADQRQMELEAREIMPYEPDTCTYPNSLRQLVFACLTCQKAGQPVGVCYSCSIQCHSTHDLVELFSKRSFVCDCGTERVNGTACSIRENKPTTTHNLGNSDTRHLTPAIKMRTGSGGEESRPRARPTLGPASDIASSDNTYNQNFRGRFCECKILYDPENETQVMHQCFFGEACGEDWYHEDCILQTQANAKNDIKGKQDEPASGTSAAESEAKDDSVKLETSPEETESNSRSSGTSDPSVKLETKDHIAEQAIAKETQANELQTLFSKDFSEFICWKCVDMYSGAFEELCSYPQIAARLKHATSENNEGSGSHLEPPRKKIKKEASYSVFLHKQFRSRLSALSQSLPEKSDLKRLLGNYPFFHKEDPIYEPPEDDTASNGSESLYDLGSNALQSLPVPQALEGLQAYDTMKEKLRGFFKGFVDQNKVVTEKEVRDFFSKMEEDRQQ